MQNPLAVIIGVIVILIICNTDKSAFYIRLHPENSLTGICINAT